MVPALLRMEAACLSMIVFVAFVFFFSRRRHTYVHRLFSEIIILAAINLTFDGITVYTVNHLDVVNPVLNFIFHKVFLGSLISVVFVVFLYILTLVQTPGAEKNLRPVWERLPFYIGLVLVLVLPIEYVETDRGNYSMGPYAYAAYAVMAIYFLASVIFFIRTWRQMNSKKVQAIIFSFSFIGICLVLQAIIPTLLISGVGVTALVLAFFFTVESPDAHLVEQLQVEKEKADAANAAKSSFLANMSHEIRTPINAVLGFNEIIMRESTEPKIVSYAHNVENAGKTLLGIINDVLDFSKIEAGKMNLLERNYELSSLINDVVNMISFRVKAKDLKVIVNMNKNIPNMLYGDDMRIKQILLNIMNNAVKYTNEGSITLSVDYDNNETVDTGGYISLDSFNTSENYVNLKVSVADTGIGIKKEELEKLFAPFERIEESKNRSVEGTGLGMTIVKRLLSMMNSSLAVESEYGKGSTFSFSIKQRVINWKPVGTLVDDTQYTDAKPYRESFHAPTARILIVDDVKLNLIVISALLKPLQIQVDTAMSGREALDLVQKKLYDIIFLDHRMPEMDGIETLAEMKKMKGSMNDGVPVIALTANAVSGAREEYIQAGFVNYLSKPVDMRHLEQALLDYLPKSKIERVSLHVLSNVTEKSQPAADEEKLPMDREQGIANCGSEELYRNVVEEFCSTAEEYAQKIEQTLGESDFKNYAIFVHSVKSSARTIGAVELAKMAASLELLALSPSPKGLEEKTPELISLLMRYRQQLV